MHRIALLLTALVLGLAVACGGGDDGDSGDPSATSTESPPTADATSADSGADSDGDSSATPAPGGGSGADSDFCSPEGAEAIFDGLDFTTAGDLEARLSVLSPALDAWVDDAPSEIRDDARIATEGMRGVIALLEENDYDLFAMAVAAEGDPRFEAITSTEFTAATDRIAAYCGIEVQPPTLGAGDSPPFNPTFGEGTLPENFPEELIPPSSEVGQTTDAGLGKTVQFTSTATLEEMREFYNDLLGDPVTSDDELTIWTRISSTSGVTVTVSPFDGALIVIVVVATSA